MKQTALLVCLLWLTAVANAQDSHGYKRSREIIRDFDSIVSPDGIQENIEAAIGGIKQSIYVRGQHAANPVILFIHGGPASPMSPLMWLYQKPVEEYFTVVQYDQRGSGKTYSQNDTTLLGKTLVTSQYVDDAIEIAELIRKKYKKQKLFLIGHSWGTIVGMKTAVKRPDLFYAYVGIGQVICTRDNEKLSFDYGVQQAGMHQNDSALRELQSIAPYPGNTPITRERIIIARKWPQYYGGLTAFRNSSNYYFDAPLLSPEYSLSDVKAIDSGSLFTLEKLMPEFLATNMKAIKSFPIPVFMFMGKHDYTTPNQPTVLWLEKVKAPIKKGIWFDNSAHLIPLEEPGKYLITLVRELLPLSR